MNDIALGFVKQALRHTARARVKRYLMGKKVPTVKAHEISDFKRFMVDDARRMAVEGGKGPIVSKAKLMKKHTARGGRFSDLKESVERSRTFTASPLAFAQPGKATSGPDGTRAVVFRNASKSKAKPKAGKTPKKKR